MASIAPPAHNRGPHTSDDWITPKLFRDLLGPFDLDPCSSRNHPWPFAPTEFFDRGLEREWFGFVWLNPPYGRETGRWLAKMAAHGNGIAFVFARTDTRMFFEHVWPKASALLFVRGRVTFHYPDGRGSKPGCNSGGPSVLIAYGEIAEARLSRCHGIGKFVRLME